MPAAGAAHLQIQLASVAGCTSWLFCSSALCCKRHVSIKQRTWQHSCSVPACRGCHRTWSIGCCCGRRCIRCCSWLPLASRLLRHADAERAPCAHLLSRWRCMRHLTPPSACSAVCKPASARLHPTCCDWKLRLRCCRIYVRQYVLY